MTAGGLRPTFQPSMFFYAVTPGWTDVTVAMVGAGCRCGRHGYRCRATRAGVLALREASPLTWTEASGFFLQAFAEAERIVAVGKTEIYVHDFQVPIPIPLEAGGAMHESFPAYRTVMPLGVRVVERLRGHRGRA